MRATTLRALAATGVLLGGAGLVLAAPRGEAGTVLKPGPNHDLVASRCGICHSLDYLPANAPAMDRAGWQKTVQKMRDRFGAPLTDEEAAAILDYLGATYAGKAPVP